MKKTRAGRNRTITLSQSDKEKYNRLLTKARELSNTIASNTIVHGDMVDVIKHVPDDTVNLLFLDPPYNLTKLFNTNTFNKVTEKKYTAWFESWFKLLLPKLKGSASVYICGDWRTSTSIYQVIKNYLIVQNRITWEREKGRGAQTNYKNSHEDIWFATVSRNYVFNLDAIKLKRKVIAPYKVKGIPKDWEESTTGNFRLTHPSNLWTDISIPFWSMPENTDHPTQKPEKLLAKLILASTNSGDVILDPFVGSGTSAVVAKKLGRNFYGIEIDEEYIYLALKRLDMADSDRSIQGYHDGVFWERNTLSIQKKSNAKQGSLF